MTTDPSSAGAAADDGRSGSVRTPIAVVRRLASHRVVSASTLIGAISEYLLIALAGHYVFLSVDVLVGLLIGHRSSPAGPA